MSSQLSLDSLSEEYKAQLEEANALIDKISVCLEKQRAAKNQLSALVSTRVSRYLQWHDDLRLDPSFCQQFEHEELPKVLKSLHTAFQTWKDEYAGWLGLTTDDDVDQSSQSDRTPETWNIFAEFINCVCRSLEGFLWEYKREISAIHQIIETLSTAVPISCNNQATWEDISRLYGDVEQSIAKLREHQGISRSYAES